MEKEKARGLGKERELATEKVKARGLGRERELATEKEKEKARVMDLSYRP